MRDEVAVTNLPGIFTTVKSRTSTWSREMGEAESYGLVALSEERAKILKKAGVLDIYEIFVKQVVAPCLSIEKAWSRFATWLLSSHAVRRFEEDLDSCLLTETKNTQTGRFREFAVPSRHGFDGSSRSDEQEAPSEVRKSASLQQYDNEVGAWIAEADLPLGRRFGCSTPGAVLAGYEFGRISRSDHDFWERSGLDAHERVRRFIATQARMFGEKRRGLEPLALLFWKDWEEYDGVRSREDRVEEFAFRLDTFWRKHVLLEGSSVGMERSSERPVSIEFCGG